MPDTLGLIEASVEDHRIGVEVFLRCAIETDAKRSDEQQRRDRTQLRAAEWQDNDIVAGLRLIWY
jgi:hypothetical protein